MTCPGCGRDPFLIQGPAVISFSGGRTSGYMLWRILQAHGGTLPDDVLVCFANTGREMPATLDFVRDCGAAWNVPIRWLEYRHKPGRAFFEEVSHNSASRDGEPFQIMLAAKSSLPNPVQRFCTIELKIRTMKRFAQSLGWLHWTNIIGLRADEPRRVEKALDHERTKKDRWHNLFPLADAGLTEEDVFRFWKGQTFDLRLKGPWEGNCDGCFLKNRAGISRILADYPDRMAWWAEMERIKHGNGAGGTFRNDREDYRTMARVVRDQGTLPFDLDEVMIPCEDAGCGI
jgi:3'-phosphoadenosine 5'-phosphosulfate sulfotransferase (PAPS reductase)/FAD synthetase